MFMILDRDTSMGVSWQGRAVLLVDLDAFFASVEQLDHPEWRGKPVIVGGRADSRGVVSTASYEARAYGVHSAMPSKTAERLCPDAIWARPRFDRYRELSQEVMSILGDESPLLEQVSIDEAFLDVSPGRYANESPISIASRIQERVSKLGITCSVGVASGKSVAKIASELDKPRGLTVVYPGSEAKFLAPMNVRAMSGIGEKSADRLRTRGILTLGDLADAPLDLLKPIFGINAERVRDKARGIDPSPIVVETGVKSVSNERTFAEDLLTRDEIEAAVDYMGTMVGRRLRHKGLAGHTVTLKLRYADLSRRTAQRSIGYQTDDERVFIPIAKELISQIWHPGDSVRLVGVGISGFEEEGETQLDLFSTVKDETSAGSETEDSAADVPPEQAGHSRDLLNAADRIRDRFGDGALTFGRQLKLKNKSTGTPDKNATE